MEDLEFTIKNKQILFKFAILFTVASVALCLMVMLIIIACRIYVKAPFIWFIEVIPAVALAGSVLWLYAYYKEGFFLKNGEFRYVKLLNKDVVIKVDTISCVYMRRLGYSYKIEFMNKEGKIIETIIDGDVMTRDGKFLEMLEKLNIEVKKSDYGDE